MHMHRPLLSVLCGMFLTVPAAADDDALRDADATTEIRSLTERLEARPSLALSTQIQFRYQANFADTNRVGGGGNADNDTTIGFYARRVKFTGSGEIADGMKGKIVIAFDRRTGDAFIEDLLVDWKLDEALTLRVGQFVLPVVREESVSSKYQLAPERSNTNETFNQDRSQGIMAMFGGDAWRGAVAFSDGFNTDNTVFNASAEADLAISGRVEIRLGGAGFKQFDQFTSFRGAAPGAMLGVAGHFQSMGGTNPAAAMNTDMSLATADVSWVGDGFNAFGAFIWRSTDTGAARFEDLGAVVQGGFFVCDQGELFARWDAVLPDSARGATGEDFHTVTVGTNYYLVPDSHAAKVTLALSWYLDPTTTSIVPTSDGANVLGDSGSGQAALTLQSQFLF